MPGKRPDGRLQACLAKSAIALRPATPAGAEFCYQLHKAAMGGYITAIWGWDEQVQRAFHEGAFNPHRWQIITAGQAGIGMLDVGYRPGEIYLSRIEIHLGHQGHGIGSRIISTLLEEAQRQGQDLVLDGPCTLSDGIARSPGTTSCTTELARCSPITPDLTRRPRRPGFKPPTGTTACLAAWRYDGECDGTTVSWPPSATGCSSSADHRPGSQQRR
jgi:GNAT superfamily N-acetyltransferase